MALPLTPALRGRARETKLLDQALERVRCGESVVLVVRGEAGIGKTALLQYCSRQASGCRIAQMAGVESELELPFAGLHQLCRPMLGDLAALPEAQERALQVAFGLAPGSAQDRFVVGLAVLSLLAEVAAKEPLVCLVDDAQWLDEGSSQVLGFVGRRLLAEAVLLVFSTRETGDERLFPALPTVTLEGLSEEDSKALLTAAVPRQLDEQIRDRIVAETRGNPLALLELPKGMSRAELAGGFGVPSTGILPGHIEDHYVRRIGALPEPTQLLMLLAAADPIGDAALLWRTAQTLGISPEAAAVAESEQLLEIRSRVRFRHPMVRSAAYAAATPENRCAVHSALAAATDPQVDPDRRVWHLAAAATEPDEDIATELEQMAGRAQDRAGLAAAAAFLQRSAALTAEPERRAERALTAARGNLHAGAFDAALGLLTTAEASAVNDLQRARVEQLRGQIEWASKPGGRAPVLLLQAAKRLETLDVSLARSTYLEAWLASLHAGRLAHAGGHLLDVSAAARSAPRPPQTPKTSDVLLDGLATLVIDGRAAAEPDLRRAVQGFLGENVSGDDWFLRGILAVTAAAVLWDFESLARLSRREVEVARAVGALAPLCNALSAHGQVVAWCGDFEAAGALIREADAVKEATGTLGSPTGSLFFAAYRGRPAEAVPLISAVAGRSMAGGEGVSSVTANWATAILHNGLGRYAEALAAAEEATKDEHRPIVTPWVLPELIEAAMRTGAAARAGEALRQLSALTVEGSDWAKGVEARSRALVSEGPNAEGWYAEAVERLGRTRLRPELARAHLLYGEWLRGQSRQGDARQQLRTAYDMFAAMGAEAFAERTRMELFGAGEKVRKLEAESSSELTPQEEHIAQLALDGRTNSEIGAELFLSARTVEWHLGKAFTKLGITSRRGLRNALPGHGRQH